MTTRIAVSLLAAVALLNADTLVLRSGARVEGRFAGGTDRTISFTVGNQVKTYNVSDVVSLQFTGQSYPANASTYGQSAPCTDTSACSVGPDPQTQNPPTSGYSQASTYPPPPAPIAPNVPTAPAAPPASPAPSAVNAGITIPAGTQIIVRMIDPVNSERDSLGQTYRASLDQPVVVNGNTVIPRGADAIATLIDAQQSGKIAGRTVLTLDLKSVTVNGRSYDIVTTGVSQQSGSRGERSAKVIGGTAALGALIGGLAGGGKGAAIGAGSGAAAGTVAEVATSGQKVKVPAETRLTFTLQNPVNL